MLRAAKAWSLSPRQWREQSADDQALMLAFDMFESTREAYRDEYRDKKRKQNDRDTNHGSNELKEMRRKMGMK